jgi:hypothetical protein
VYHSNPAQSAILMSHIPLQTIQSSLIRPYACGTHRFEVEFNDRPCRTWPESTRRTYQGAFPGAENRYSVTWRYTCPGYRMLQGNLG